MNERQLETIIERVRMELATKPSASARPQYERLYKGERQAWVREHLEQLEKGRKCNEKAH